MNSLIDMFYVDGDPIRSVIGLCVFLVVLEFGAVICAYIGGMK